MPGEITLEHTCIKARTPKSYCIPVSKKLIVNGILPLNRYLKVTIELLELKEQSLVTV